MVTSQGHTLLQSVMETLPLASTMNAMSAFFTTQPGLVGATTAPHAAAAIQRSRFMLVTDKIVLRLLGKEDTEGGSALENDGQGERKRDQVTGN